MIDELENPYRWDSDQPVHRVSRGSLIERVQGEILKGNSGYLVGCRGMGKTVFLRELAERLKETGNLDVVAFSGAPVDNHVSGMVDQLVDSLLDRLRERHGESEWLVEPLERLEEGRRRKSLERVIDTYLTASDEVERLVLLYDELEHYEARPGRDFFNGLEVVRKKSGGQLVVFAAGGVGLVALDTVRASSFFSRLEPHVLEPFNREELIQLAAPFAGERGQMLSEEMIERLRLSSGGHVMLATYGLQMLWDTSEPDRGHIEDILVAFRHLRYGTITHIRAPVFGHGDLPQAPREVWKTLKKTGGKIERVEFERIVRQMSGKHEITTQWVLTMLRATGLIRCRDAAYVQRVVEVEIIPSILSFESTADVSESTADVSESTNSIREQLVSDLSEFLVLMHRTSIDLTRAVDKGKGKKRELHEEALYSGVISMGLQLRGWRADREAQSAAGRTDIKASHCSFGEQQVVIEVKIWPRNDYVDIHQQVQDYWTEGVKALVTVMVSDRQQNAWKQDYERKCLAGKAETITEQPIGSGAIEGHFTASTALSAVPVVDHFLLRLPVR